MSFGGFSNFPRKHGIYGDPPSTLGPVVDNIQGFKKSQVAGMRQPDVIYVPPKKTPPLSKLEPQILWFGIFNGYSGYAKANREISKRARKIVKIGFAPGMDLSGEKNSEHIQLFNSIKAQSIDPRAPQVTFLLPRSESRPGYRVIYTMMETEVVHPDMIRIMNSQYHECWVPTAWNAGTFKRSGLTIPINVMPLGIDPAIYHPNVIAKMPQALCLTGQTAGRYETPSGFLFIYVCQPTFRKGIEVVIEAFGQAFPNDKEAGLIIASTAHSKALFHPDPSVTSRIWLLDAPVSENDLASIYKACKVYVCASRGEGYNLPVVESAACGLPVIVPRTSAHCDLVPDSQGFFFSPDHTTTFPNAKEISPWFDGMVFPDFGEKSINELTHTLRMVKDGYRSAKELGLRFMKTVREKYTWDIAASKVVQRIKELCSG